MKLIIFFILILKTSISHQLNTAICTSIHSLNDRSGNLIKKLCEVHRGVNYHDTQMFCRENGMNLLVLDSRETFDALANYMHGNWIAKTTPAIWSSPQGMWVNGRRNVVGRWFTYANVKRRLSSDIPWLFDSLYGGSDESCLVIKKDGQFSVSGVACSHTYYSFCEFEVMRSAPGSDSVEAGSFDELTRNNEILKMNLQLAKIKLEKCELEKSNVNSIRK